MQKWRRQSRKQWLIDWGEFRYLLPKTALREHYDRSGNPVAWLSFDHIDVVVKESDTAKVLIDGI